MPRKMRPDVAGGRYHVLNRGNYRSWILDSDRAKGAFEKALFEACERAGWKLHAHAIMGNHYHLALETPKGNLSEGMRWLQSVFANRFNRFHGEGGHLFQGRFKSLVVEDFHHLANVCHYLHLNPVRAGICTVTELANYRWTSLYYLSRKRERPGCLEFSTALDGAGCLRDGPKGWEKYTEYLAWLAADEGAQREKAFARMSQGWAIGSDGFSRAMTQDEKEKRSLIQLTGQEARAAREAGWEETTVWCLKELSRTETDIGESPKAAPWKVAIAAMLKSRQMARNGWIAERLGMGTLTGVSRYVGECLRNEKPEAKQLFDDLTTRLKDCPCSLV